MLEELEPRNLMSVTDSLLGGVLTVTGGPGRETIHISLDQPTAELVVQDAAGVVGRFASSDVQSIAISTGDGGLVTVDDAVLQPTVIHAGSGAEVIRTGGGPTTVYGGSGPDKMIAGSGPATLIGGTGRNALYPAPPRTR